MPTGWRSGACEFIWDVQASVDVTLDNPPVNTKAQTSQVAAKSSSATLTFSIDGGPKRAGHPAQSARWRRGSHAAGVGGQSRGSACLFMGARDATRLWPHGSQRGGERHRWHELHAVATDPLGHFDPEGFTRRFADFEPPEAHLELPSVQRETGPFAV